MRQRLVDYIVKVYAQIASIMSRKPKICPNNSVIHLAITYIDIILSKHLVPKEKMKGMAIMGLSIASKFDEMDDNIPLAKEFIKFSGLTLSYDNFIKNESQILKNYLNWDLNAITVFQVAESLIELGIIYEDDRIKNSKIDPTSFINIVKRVYFFIDLSTEGYQIK